MSYLLITLALCFCCLLCGTSSKAGDSTTDDMSQGINNVAVDFHTQTSGLNSTSKIVSSRDHSTATWIWKPIGHERNDIEFEPILRLFKGDSGSGQDDEIDDEPVNETQKEEIWTFNATIEQKVNTTQSPKLTLDRKRNETEEKVYLINERHLRKTNWCFKDTESAIPNNKFKKTEVCCRKHRECQARRHVKREIYECSCDIYFHICLKKAHTKMAKSIEEMYFNRNIVCYKKDRKACTNELCPDVKYMWKVIPRHLK